MLLFFTAVTSRAQEHPFTVSIGGLLSTSSELFPHSNDPDENIRGQFLPLDDLFGISIDIRRQFDDLGVQLGLSIEYISKTESYVLPITHSTSVPLTDGFTAVPIELSAYFVIPIGDETLQLYMGGGGGLYIGNRNYTIANVTAPTVGRTAQVGIHVLGGAQYLLSPLVSLRSEVKFRDVQFETVNRFQQPNANYHGTTVALDQQPLASRISINGMTVTLGVAVHF